MRIWLVSISALSIAGGIFAQETSTIRAYVDSDLCARLMLGPITPKRTDCSESTIKEGSVPVLVRLQNNMVFSVNKEKVVRPLVGQLAEASGQLNVKNGTMKIDSANPIKADSIGPNDPERRLLDPQKYNTKGSAELFEKIRHELAMMPYVGYFDFISFTLNGSDVILTGWTVRDINRSTAYNSVKNIKGVESVVNNIDILPLGSFDMQIRAAALARITKTANLSRYFWPANSTIKIIVKNGNIILVGAVGLKADSDMAFIQANSVPGAFKVFNMLEVRPGV
jgi:osmotically-inducible protein OsmY